MTTPSDVHGDLHSEDGARPIGGVAVDLTDPSGTPVCVVADTAELPVLPAQCPQVFNVGHELHRANIPSTAPREPARVQRLGHVVLQSTRYLTALNWYLDLRATR